MIIAVFTPHGGCPERCHFCDQKVSGGIPVSASHVIQTIEEHLASRGVETNSKTTHVEVAFYGGTFTSMPKARQIAYLEAVKPYLNAGKVQAVRLSTRPDALDEPWLETLYSEYGVRTVELGVQSFNPSALAAMGRTHTQESVERAVSLLKKLGMQVSLHLMLGCPDESVDEDALTLRQLERLKPAMVRIHPLLVLAGTEMEALWKQGRYQPLSLEEAVARAAWLTERAEAIGIRVIRLGLQPNDLLGGAVLTGPYHPAFGDLVRSRIERNRAELALVTGLEQTQSGQRVEIHVSSASAFRLRAHKGAALSWLKERFNLSSIQVHVLQESPPYGIVQVRVFDSGGSAQCR